MPQYTSLHKCHRKAGAFLVDFAGWEMPLHYGSQIDEHHQVRKHAGIFDVSHMGVVDIEGEDATYYLRHLFANDVHKLKESGRALYTCMLNENGGVLDDLIVYRLDKQHYRLIINAATCEKDLAWMEKQGEWFDVAINERQDFSIMAIQGPKALEIAAQVFDHKTAEKIKDLRPFRFILSHHLLIARTGYTGEDGIEIVVPNEKAPDLWKQFIAKGAKVCGLGARDTLRLEAGLNLYGADMDESTSPLISNLAWTICWSDSERDFVGRKALQQHIEAGVKEQLVGLVMEQPGVLRNHQKVWIDSNGGGEITSGGFSPTLGHAIALARVPVNIGDTGKVERRGQSIPIKIIKPPFVRRGETAY